MRRRDFLIDSALAAAAAAAHGGLARWPELNPQPVTVTIGGPQKLPPIPPGFMGLGYEISSVSRPGLLSRANRPYVELVKNLGTRGVIRIGGNTADYAHYRAQAALVSSPYGTVVNAAALRELGGFLEETGWQLIWALNLGSASADEAIAEARAVIAAAGKHLLAFEIGNEPDLFSHEKHRSPGYGYEAWLADFRRYKAALRAQIPAIPLAGPDVAGKTDWVTRFAADEGKDVVLLTHHYYREGQNPGSTMEKLLGADPKLQPQLEQLQAASSKSGIPYRICEVNSFSGGGRPGVSDSMAGALWALDYLFTLACAGCSGVNMETGVNQLDFVSSYSPIADDKAGHCQARPEYYGLLAFAEFGRGSLLDTTVEGNPALLKAYATVDANKRLRITLINKGEAGAVLHVSTGSHGRQPAHVIRLTAQDVRATSGVTLGGAQVSPQGRWQAAGLETVPQRAGLLEISLPGYSAAMARI